MDPNFPNEFRRSSRAGQAFLFLLALALVVSAFAWMARPRDEAKLLPQGPAPEIRAVGWVNGEAPTKASLAGKVVVIEVWATWCRPCHEMLPRMVALHDRYADRGVVFVGLTSEAKAKVPTIESVLNKAGARWPTGWGAEQTIRELGVEYLPSIFVVGRNGQIVWTISDGGDLADALEKALKEPSSRT